MNVRGGNTTARGRAHERTGHDAVALWSTIAAVVLGLTGIGRLIAWGNRWYVAETFAAPAAESAGDAESWAWAYDRLHDAHEALVTGVVLLLVAGVATAVAVRARRAR